MRIASIHPSYALHPPLEGDYALKVKDGERAAIALKGIEGKRLTYRPADKAEHD